MQFLYPNVLFLLALLGGLIFLLSTNKDNMERFFTSDILNKLLVQNKSMGKSTRNILFFMTLILFVIALARPVMNMKERNIKQRLIPIVIALDVSKSMRAADIYPSRLDLAKKKLKQIIALSKNTTIGIVLFAQNSYIVSPVTEDFTSLNYIVDNLDTTLNFANGSNVYAVLEATSQMLQEYKVKNLIILSDGGNDNLYSDELEFAKENEITIYTIGLATKQGSPIPVENGYLTDANGKIVTVALNESIKNLSLNSGGGYIDFSLSHDDSEAIVTQIQKQSKKEELVSKKIKTYTELFYYPLALGILSLLIAFSSLPRRKIAVFVILTFIYPQDNLAGMLDFKNLEKAKEEYQNKNYKKAISNYKKVKVTNESNYNLANSYYKNGEYKKAIQSYDKIITSDKNLEYKKLHNLGNSYVKEKNLEKAKEFYEKALKLKDDEQTKENLEAVKKAMKKKENKDKKNQKKEDKKQDKDKKENKKQDKDAKKGDKKNGEKKEDNDKEKQQKAKKEEDKKKKNKDNKNEKNKSKKDTKKEGKEQSEVKQSKPSQKDISDMEEKKWMKSLQNKKTPILLQKVKSRIPTSADIEQPW
ncbi:MAG: VWA domain-containing protein [Arcobacteraceae bacterium]|nr:VWA domain-containing protein [Arcobacteraceae bacterium]